MTWRDRLSWVEGTSQTRKKASFRGATFFIRDSDRSVGRRTVSHQYPKRDDPYIEDMGRDMDEFTINGYVIQNQDNGQDYINERDVLIKALRQSGSGTLIHPFYGNLLVSLVGKARISESFAEGGIARFTMTFVQVVEGLGLENDLQRIPSPKSTQDHVNAVDTAVDDSLNFTIDGFGETFDPADMPGHTANSIMMAIGSLNTMLRSVILSVRNAGPAQISRALNFLAVQYAGISLSTINDTCGLANGLIGMLNGLQSLAGMYGDLVLGQLLGACSSVVRGYNRGPMSGAKVGFAATGYASSTLAGPAKIDEGLGKTTVRALLELNKYGDGTSTYGGAVTPITITTCQRARQSANLISIINLVRNSAIATAAKTAIRINYTSYNAAVDMMNEVISALDDHILKLGDDAADTDYDDYNITISDPNSFQAMESLRPVFVEAMRGVGAELATVVDYVVPPAVMLTLVLAYSKYSDLDRESEIIDRNIPTIKHPGFMPGGQTIEILSE